MGSEGTRGAQGVGYWMKRSEYGQEEGRDITQVREGRRGTHMGWEGRSAAYVGGVGRRRGWVGVGGECRDA